MTGHIIASKLTTLAITRDKITVGAPFVGYTKEEAYASLRKNYSRIVDALAARAGFRICDITSVGISACGGYVTMQSFVWRD